MRTFRFPSLVSGAAAIRSGWKTVVGASVLASALLIASNATFAQDGSGDGSEGESELLDGSHPFEGPLVFSPGLISLTLASPEISEFQFDTLATPLAGYPGSLFLAETPFGPSALLRGDDATGPGYYYVVPNFGVTVPLTYSEPTTAYVGPVGTGTVTVTTAATVQDPAGPKTSAVKNGKGTTAIIIKAPCLATFKQFFTKTITWKGTKPNPNGGPPIDVGGTFNGPTTGTGNGGQPVNTDGQTVYCDAPAGNGDYPTTRVNGDGTTSMIDAPNVNNPDGTAAKIKAQPGNGNVTITEVTTTWHFTTYVLCGGVVTWKVEWVHSETNKIPSGPPPHAPNGGFSGRSQGPPPPGSPWSGTPPDVKPATGLDPQHAAALGAFQTGGPGAYNGAPAVGGW